MCGDVRQGLVRPPQGTIDAPAEAPPEPSRGPQQVGFWRPPGGIFGDLRPLPTWLCASPVFGRRDQNSYQLLTRGKLLMELRRDFAASSKAAFFVKHGPLERFIARYMAYTLFGLEVGWLRAAFVETRILGAGKSGPKRALLLVGALDSQRSPSSPGRRMFRYPSAIVPWAPTLHGDLFGSGCDFASGMTSGVPS